MGWHGAPHPCAVSWVWDALSGAESVLSQLDTVRAGRVFTGVCKGQLTKIL